MVDLKTLGNDGLFPAVFQIGAVCFDIKTGEHYREFSCTINLEEQMHKGFHDYVNSIYLYDFLKIQKRDYPENANKMIESSYTMDQFCDEFSRFMDESFVNENVKLWATNAICYVGISNLYASCRKGNPIPHNTRLCFDTVKHLYNQKNGNIKKHENSSAHDAIDDCYCQINELIVWLKDFSINY